MKRIVILILFIQSLNYSAQTYNAGTVFQSYTDINPDSLIWYTVAPYTMHTYSFNLCGDAGPDLVFTAQGAVSPAGSAAYIRVEPVNSNLTIRFGRWDSVWVPGSSSWTVTKVAKPLNSGEAINSINAVWDASTLYLTDYSGFGGGNKTVGDWVGSEKFLGLKFQNGAVVDYGWVKIHCPSKDSCYVKEYSFTNTLASEKENPLSSMNIFPNPFTNEFYIQAEQSLLEIGSIHVSDMWGNKITCSQLLTDSAVRIILPENLYNGCYILNYCAGEQNFYRKIIKVSDQM